jgi:hypothetical protein
MDINLQYVAVLQIFTISSTVHLVSSIYDYFL